MTRRELPVGGRGGHSCWRDVGVEAVGRRVRRGVKTATRAQGPAGRDGWAAGALGASVAGAASGAVGGGGAAGGDARPGWAGRGRWGLRTAEGEAAADPKSVAEVQISGLSGSLTYGGSDGFTVTASNLTTVVGYDVIVSRNNGTLGIGACGTGSQTQRVSGVTSQNLSFTVRACWAGSGTVTAVVRRSGLTINENAYRQTVTVQARAPAAPARPTAPNPKAREFTGAVAGAGGHRGHGADGLPRAHAPQWGQPGRRIARRIRSARARAAGGSAS